MSESCNECGKSVKIGSGRFVNRIPDLNDVETKKAMGKPFPEGEYICDGCDKIRDKEIESKTEEQIMLDYIKMNFPQVYDEAESHYINSVPEGKTEKPTTVTSAGKEAGMLQIAKAAYNGSYVARIAGADEKFGYKREFLEVSREYAEKEKGQFNMSVVDETQIKKDDIISLKIVKKGQARKEATENFYKITKDPAEAEGELHNIVAKLSKEDLEKIFPPVKEKGKATEKDALGEDMSEGLDR
jgi:hypothetical protein